MNKSSEFHFYTFNLFIALSIVNLTKSLSDLSH